MSVDQIAEDLLEIQFQSQPLYPALLGLDLNRPGLGDISEQDEQATTARVRAISDRANAVDPVDLTAQTVRRWPW